MSESELIKRITELEAYNLALIAENRKLRRLLGVQEDVVSSINKYSSPEEKIELFLSLFRGRTDVYAKRCYSQKHESSYYIPACKNEWVKGLCDRGQID